MSNASRRWAPVSALLVTLCDLGCSPHVTPAPMAKVIAVPAMPAPKDASPTSASDQETEITIRNADGMEKQTWVKPFELVYLDGHHRPPMPYPWSGETTISYSLEDGILKVNGKVVGLDLEADASGESLKALVERYRASLRVIAVWHGDGPQMLSAEVLQAIGELASQDVVLSLGENVRVSLEGLGGLQDKLVGLGAGPGCGE